MMPVPEPAVPGLNGSQKAAVERENQDVCVVAGPGSGKTRVLVERFARLVEKGVDPEKILAITFTEKAATELKQRLAARFEAKAEQRRKIERAQISTIHGFCHAILREHALAAGLDPRFELLDDLEAALLRGEAMQEALDEFAGNRPEEFLRLAEVWPAARIDDSLLAVAEAMRAAGKFEEVLATRVDTAGIIQDLLAQLRCKLHSAEGLNRPTTDARRRRLAVIQDLLQRLDQLSVPQIEEMMALISLTGERDTELKAAVKAARELMPALKAAWVLERFLPQRQLLLEILRRFHDIARQKRRSAGLLDFSDLEEYTLELLRGNQDIRRAVSDRYEHVLMDELQDTNPVQWEILSLVRRQGRFFAVGDVNQSIYSFRHAEPALFKQYEQSVSSGGWTVDRLRENYRSRAEILDAVSRILVDPPKPGIEPHTLEAASAFSETGGPYVELLCVDRQNNPDTDVMLHLAARLRELYGTTLADGKTARFDHMAVFVRNSSSFAAVEDALRRFRIPYVVAGGKSYFDSIEVVDLLNALRVLARPEDDIALFALLRSPFFGRSDEELLLNRVRTKSLALPEDEAFLDSLRDALVSQTVSLVLSRLLDETGYLNSLSASASANVEKFLSLIDQTERRVGHDIVAVVEHIEQLQQAASEAQAPALEAGDAVRLMTIHKAKGLEFPIVAVAALEKGERNQTDAALYHPESGLGFRWLIEDGDTADDLFMAKARALLKEKNDHERNRLLYVALTRAMERLILAFTKTSRPGPWPNLILNGLRLQIPAEPGGQGASDLAVITHVSGVPEVPAALDLHAPVPQPELEPLSPPREAPSEIAVTALATFAQCPRRCLLESVLHWPLPPGGDGGGALGLGTEVHEYLAGLRMEVSDEARQLAYAFEQSQLARRASRAPVQEREKDFLVEIEGTLLRGQIDLWFDEGDGPVLVDYKTDRYLGEARMRGYELQMRLYAIALERLTGRPVREAWLFPLREDGPHPVDISHAALNAALEILRQWRAAEQSGSFPTRESPDCQWCPFASGPCPVPRPPGPGL
ncbi:MAG: UvrD-helicase domain-containing protein [Acidobacteriota bacterium]